MFRQFNKPYNPKEIEDKIYRLWKKSGYFNPDNLPGKRKKTFSAVMAPPNITGHIHLGHAFENILTDILIRQKRMAGYKTLFLPGKDHAGIAGQYAVEKELKKENKTRFDLGKEKFLKRIWEWMKTYGSAIETEIKALGISCDWSRKRFTMDKDYQKAVSAAFAHYYKKGWIYQTERVINWCPRCQTSLSDLEIERKETEGHLWYIKYPIKKASGFIMVATARPETMLGDSAVAVNPNDQRYKNLINKTALLPLLEREIPIIADKLIDQDFGAGAVKITPAHDALDAEIGKNHKLPVYKVIGKDNKIIAKDGGYFGLSVFEARKKIIEDLEQKNLIEKVEDYSHNIGYCERCKAITESLPSKQWFLKMDKLAKKTIEAAEKNKLLFIPKQRKKIFIRWGKNIRDWNISRQLWWGHKLPIFYCGKKQEEFSISNFQFSKKCPICKNCRPKQTLDVLDTWFSSALWPFAALGWPQKTKDLKTFYPASIISSAREIFFLWIFRMSFSGLEFMKKAPFLIIYTHATILDKNGKKMSKSLGNVVDPMDLIKEYGVDTTRFALIWQAMTNQDIHWDETSLIAGKKFLNKIWNASRFVLQQQIENSKFKIQNLTSDDTRILKELKRTAKSVDKDLENFQFGKAVHTLYDFFWHDFCDKYLERSKKQMSNEKLKRNTQQILAYVLFTFLKLLHPFLPFITESIYQKLPFKEKGMMIIEDWPK